MYLLNLDNWTVDGEMLAELRSDHAGESGAVAIYDGVLAVSRDAELRRFATEHRATEQRHLDYLHALLPAAERSRLLPLWWLSGWLLGALPAFLGPRAVYRTVAAVESFVDEHYQRQLDYLAAFPELRELRAQLASFQAEEVHHRDEASGRLPPPGVVARVWTRLVAWGSAAAVVVCKRL